MASYQAVAGVLSAIKDHLETQMSAGLAGSVANPKVRILGSQDLRGDPSGNELGLYLHRISVDPYGRNRYLRPSRPGETHQPELPVNLHLLIVGWSLSAAAETTLVAWAMQQIGSALDLDIAHLGLADAHWGEQDRVQVLPEEMSTEDLMRVWDSLPGDYRLSSPYLVKTLRLEPANPVSAGPALRSIVVPVETA
ncbi:MAG: DUF4255 domain-containing protein [Betaproteobacteria bacterium]|nr:DUF4255 domain-containing protein [Betaproteobacteria bacterium]